MSAVVKAMWADSVAINLDSYFPDDPENFGMWLELKIGPTDAVGADDFRLFVCTPCWLKNERRATQWGRHMLVVCEYDLDVIKTEIEQCIEKCIGASWTVTAQKIARFLAWEFEDFQP